MFNYLIRCSVLLGHQVCQLIFRLLQFFFNVWNLCSQFLCSTVQITLDSQWSLHT